MIVLKNGTITDYNSPMLDISTKIMIGRNSKIFQTNLSTPTVINKLVNNGAKEAFYICDLNDVVKKYFNWTEKIPRVKPHYAIKCNSHDPVIEILAALGAGFDCASRQEMQQVLSLEIEPDRIIYANPTKIPTHLKYAADNGIKKMTFDCEFELHKIKKICPNAELVLRMRFDDPLALYPLGRKFGCDPDKDVEQLLMLAKTLDLNVIGVAFHIGSSSQNPEIFGQAIKKSSEIFKIAEKMGYQFNFLDIGGGYLGEIGTSIDPTAKVINTALDNYFSDLNIEIISEPGRYFVSSAFTLTANIHTIKVENLTNNQKHYHYFIDDGVYGSFMAILFDERLPGKPLKYADNLQLYPSTIWGPTCDGSDRVDENCLLPEMSFGDWLVFENMGAYTNSLSTRFNGLEIPKTFTIVSEKNWKYLEDKVAWSRLEIIN